MTRDELIEKASRVIHEKRYLPSMPSPTVVDESIATALADAGPLADPERRPQSEPPAEFADAQAALAWRLASVIHDADDAGKLHWSACEVMGAAAARAVWGIHVEGIALARALTAKGKAIEERDALQARLTRVEALCAEWETNPAADWTAGDAAEHVRAALQGDQPTKSARFAPVESHHLVDELPLADRARMRLEGQPAEEKS